jgi:hypothetical protein
MHGPEAVLVHLPHITAAETVHANSRMSARSRRPPLFAELFLSLQLVSLQLVSLQLLSLQHIRLTAISRRHIQKTLGYFGV